MFVAYIIFHIYWQLKSWHVHVMYMRSIADGIGNGKLKITHPF